MANNITDKDLRIYHYGNSYADELNVDCSNKSILDFGCNSGRLPFSFPEDLNCSYTGVDVQKTFIDELSTQYPNYNFVHFNKYHPSYNFYGNKVINLSDILDDTYDIIFAWNVFTHCSYTYTLPLLSDLQSMLNENGYIIFNLYSPEKLIELSPVIKKNVERFDNIDINTKIWIDSVEEFSERMYWENTDNILYDEEIDNNTEKTQLFSAYKLSWIQENNPTWELLRNKNNVYTFKIGA
jgi:SAM-dependent methyltransferase